MADLEINNIKLEEVRKKYDFERDRRIRDDRNEQYIEPEGDFAYFTDDPYAREKLQRAPLDDRKDVIIIGGGFGGLLVGAQLRNAGFEDLRIIEKGSDFGGTWYWNRYPGVQCDVEAYIYLPLLEETGYMPSLKYAFGDEIHEHTKRIANRYDLGRDVCFQTEVTEVSWLEDEQLWQVKTDRDDLMRAKYVCVCNGPLDRPRLPGIPGITQFKGYSFHTSRWDYEYTGGNLHGGLNKLADKKVAIIGTGATAVQCVPHLATHAKHLYVVQRTPSSIDERNNAETDEEWFKSLKPGWQEKRCDNFNDMIFGFPSNEDQVHDGWTDMVHNFEKLLSSAQMSGEFTPESTDELMEIADFQSMERIRQRAADIVKDPETANKLKAWYRKWCKRPGFHDEYLQSFNRPNVTLLDTDGKGLTRITDKAIVVGDQEYEVDCLIFATGFEVGTSHIRRAGYDIIGRNEQSLTQKWEDGPKTQFGMQVNGFPNCFFTGVIHAAVGINLTQMLNEQAKHISHTIKQVEQRKGKRVELSPEAEQDWGVRIQNSGLAKRRDFLGSCTPGYYNGEGDPQGKGGVWEHEYSAGAADFYGLLRDWRAVNYLPGLQVDGSALTPSQTDLEYMRTEPAIRARLHREMKLLRHRMDMANIPLAGSVPVSEFREIFAAGAASAGKGPDLPSVKDHVIDSNGHDLPVRIYHGCKNPDSIVVYFHGGGWCFGSTDTHDAIVRRLAKASRATVVSVDYRLAPESPFPAAVDDSVSALLWADGQRAELARDGTPLFVCGDSAGGNLAAVMSLLARDSLGVDIAGQILIYPSVDGDMHRMGLDAFEPPVLKKSEILWCLDQYIPQGASKTDPRLAPIAASSHANLPPALILTADLDLLKIQGEAYAEKLKQDQTQVRFKNFEGAMHGFFSDGIGLLQSNEAVDEIASFILGKL